MQAAGPAPSLSHSLLSSAPHHVDVGVQAEDRLEGGAEGRLVQVVGALAHCSLLHRQGRGGGWWWDAWELRKSPNAQLGSLHSTHTPRTRVDQRAVHIYREARREEAVSGAAASGGGGNALASSMGLHISPKLTNVVAMTTAARAARRRRCGRAATARRRGCATNWRLAGVGERPGVIWSIGWLCSASIRSAEDWSHWGGLVTSAAACCDCHWGLPGAPALPPSIASSITSLCTVT